MKRTNPLVRTLAPLTLAALVLTACGGSDDAATSSTIVLTPRVVVTSVKDDPTSQLLAAVYARVLEDAGFRVSRKDPVDMDRAEYYAAIQAGEFQLIPDFSADLLHFVYDQPGAPVSPTTVAPAGPASTEAPIVLATTSTVASLTNTTVASGDTTASTTADTTADTSAATTTTAAPSTTAGDTTTTEPVLLSTGRSITEQLVAIRAALPTTLDASNGFFAEHKLMVACTPDAMKSNETVQLITLTNLASIAPSIRLAGSAEFMAAADGGLATLLDTYGAEFEDIVTVEEADMAKAVDEDTADCFATDSMNPVITTKRLTTMVDDKVMVESNAALALLAKDVATAELLAALDTLSTALTTERLNQMLNEVVANGTDPVVVANAFMDSI
jgi:glycine betaine/choline ABC-type transport system substrate-binding protein